MALFKDILRLQLHDKAKSIDMLAALWAAVTCWKEEDSIEQRKCKSFLQLLDN